MGISFALFFGLFFWLGRGVSAVSQGGVVSAGSDSSSGGISIRRGRCCCKRSARCAPCSPAFSTARSRILSRRARHASARLRNQPLGRASHFTSFHRENVDTRYIDTTSAVRMATTAPARFSASSKARASANPTAPPPSTMPLNTRNGNSDKPTDALTTSKKDPITFTRPEGRSSERIHFQASTKVRSGNKNAATPKI